MHELEKRLAARTARKANPDAWRLPAGEKSDVVKAEGEDLSGKDDQFADMTIAQLKEWASANGAAIPTEKTSKVDILEFVRNLAAYKAANGGNSPVAGWNNNN